MGFGIKQALHRFLIENLFKDLEDGQLSCMLAVVNGTTSVQLKPMKLTPSKSVANATFINWDKDNPSKNSSKSIMITQLFLEESTFQNSHFLRYETWWWKIRRKANNICNDIQQ